ncbi:MAG: helix-turn-helix domain-containing protein [Sphaerochaeta sp.]|jgi:DNA-binding XRE family transcriptional regulator|nr:helix-turn-helix domain-containing protein [Sphaerochaeta sp.]
MKIGVDTEALREARIRAFFTQHGLAKATGCHYSTMSLIEGGKRQPSPRIAGKIAAVLGKDFDDLFFTVVGEEDSE